MGEYAEEELDRAYDYEWIRDCKRDKLECFICGESEPDCTCDMED